MPLAALAKPIGAFRLIVTGPGDQTQPSIDGNYVVYSGPAAAAGDGLDVLRFDLLAPTEPPAVIAGGAGDQDVPDVFGTVVGYRGPLGITIWDWSGAMALRSPSAAETASAPSVGSNVAAWEFWDRSDRDIRVFRLGSTAEYGIRADQAVPRPGDQHGPAAYGDFVAFIDEADGASVQLHDSTSGASGSTLLCPGRVIGVALGRHGAEIVAAIARADGIYDYDVEVRDLAGNVIGQPLHVRGEQRNPHVSGEWVAFEDLSTLHSQVVLWQWTTGLVFVPHPSSSDQRLNDLYAGEGVVRVVFADDAAGDLDIALYELSVSPSIPDDGLPSNWPPVAPPAEPATCAPDGGTQLALLELARDGQRPEAGEYAFQVDGEAMPVLVCIDAQRVSAAWVTLDDEAIATPSDFRPDVVHLEVRSAVDAAGGKVSAVLAGMPGAVLTVRVIADPARRTTATSADVGSPALRAAAPPEAGAFGCGNSGGGALGLVAALALGLLRRRS